LGDSKEKAAATACFVKPLSVEKEKRKKKRTHTHMHTESWCCDRSSLELSAEFNVLLLLFFNNVECLPCSSCYIYVCNASQNLSIFRSHRG